MTDDLGELGIDFDERKLELFGEFASELMDKSRIMNLIGPGERPRLWRRHFLESVQYGLLVDKGRTVVDIGSGNGFPGMILAIMGFRMTLLEPRRKRYLFLKRAASELGLTDCITLPIRLEDFDPEDEVKQFVARSVAPPASLLSQIAIVAGKGSILVYRQPEISVNEEVERYIELNCPPLDRGGFLVQYRV